MKKPFILLELLVALSLFATCIVPLIEIPARALRTEMNVYKRLQVLRMSDLAFAEIRTSLALGTISWDQVCSSDKQKTLVLDDTVAVAVPGLKGTTSLRRRCYVKSSLPKIGSEKQEYRLLDLQVEFSSARPLFFPNKKIRTIRYKLMVERTTL